MRYLIDTCVLIWSLADNERISAVRDVLTDSANEIFYSAASIWEIAIKNMNGRMDLTPGMALEGCALQGFSELPMTSEHCKETQKLRYPKGMPIHKDPFDRMLIAQAKSEGMLLITADRDIGNFLEPCIMMI